MFQLRDILKALSVGQRARRIHRLNVTKGETLAVLADAGGFFAFAQRTVLPAPTSEYVKVFQREARRINLRVADIARRLRAVFVELLADRRCAARIGFTAGTEAGGGGTCWPKMRSIIQTPRSTGEVVVPFAVTFNTLACVSSPPRTESGGSCTRRIAEPSTPCNRNGRRAVR